MKLKCRSDTTECFRQAHTPNPQVDQAKAGDQRHSDMDETTSTQFMHILIRTERLKHIQTEQQTTAHSLNVLVNIGGEVKLWRLKTRNNDKF